MKAVIYQRYGAADVLQVGEAARPEPAANEVLIRIHETIVTPTDIAARQGKPFMIRFFSGLFRPNSFLGNDLAGVVEAVGRDVTQFQPGDRVFGATNAGGTYAEYICLPEAGVLATIPDNLTFAQTAGICDAAMTALSFLRDEAGLKPGQKLLINGASGAIGTFAVQLGKHFGADVTGVCSGANGERVLALGADRVIDYTKEDFTGQTGAYDVIFDAVGKSSFARCRGALKAGGVYMTTVPSLGILLQMLRTSFLGDKKAIFAATGLSQNKEKLHFLRELLATGRLQAVVDRRYPLTEIVAAHQYVEAGHKVGNVIIQLPAAA